MEVTFNNNFFTLETNGRLTLRGCSNIRRRPLMVLVPVDALPKDNFRVIPDGPGVEVDAEFCYVCQPVRAASSSHSSSLLVRERWK